MTVRISLRIPDQRMVAIRKATACQGFQSDTARVAYCVSVGLQSLMGSAAAAASADANSAMLRLIVAGATKEGDLSPSEAASFLDTIGNKSEQELRTADSVEDTGESEDAN